MYKKMTCNDWNKLNYSSKYTLVEKLYRRASEYYMQKKRNKISCQGLESDAEQFYDIQAKLQNGIDLTAEEITYIVKQNNNSRILELCELSMGILFVIIVIMVVTYYI